MDVQFSPDLEEIPEALELENRVSRRVSDDILKRAYFSSFQRY